MYIQWVSKVRVQSNFCEETRDEIISRVFTYQTSTFVPKTRTLTTQTSTLCSMIASNIFTLTFSPTFIDNI